MAKFCTNCGAEIEEGIAFCTQCGTKITEDAKQGADVQPQEEKATEEKAPAPINPAPEPITAPSEDETKKVVGIGLFFGLILLFAIPVVGWIACIIMAFAPKNKNVKNYARAMLIWLVIGLVVSIGMFFLVRWVGTMIFDYINTESGGIFDRFGELFDNFSSIGEMMDGLGDMSDLVGEGGQMEEILGSLDTSALETAPIE